MSMVGSWGAKGYITEYLKDDLPARLVGYRNLWQLDDNRLPMPEKILSYEPSALDAWPTIITVVINTSNINRLDYTDATDPVYAITYAIRTYVWCRGSGPEQTTQARDNLTAVVRTALLDRPCLRSGVHGYQSIHEVSMDEGSLKEEYSDLTQVKGERWIAGAYLAYDFMVEETVTRETLGTVSTTSASVTLLDLT